jgi:hypothetical protein
MLNQTIKHSGRTKRLAAAALTALVAGSASVASAAPIVATPGVTAGVSNVTSVGITASTGIATTVDNVTGAGASYSPFLPSNTYTVNYAGTLDAVSTVTAGGTTYRASGLATNVIRRYTGANNDQLWYTGTSNGTGNGSTINLSSIALGGFSQAFDQNAINVGADNLFSTIPGGAGSNPTGNNTNVDRVDLLFAGGLTASANSIFVISDRGDSDDHDAFDIAAITSVDGNGNPLTYGPLLSFKDGTWGTTDVAAATEEFILRTNDNITGDTLHPSDYTEQAVGAVAISTTALVAGTGATTIYGYSLFSPDLDVSGNGAGNQLDNWQNGNVYKTADSTSTGGGLDPAAFIAELYTTTAVPEPTSVALIGIVAAGLLGRRGRRTVA